MMNLFEERLINFKLKERKKDKGLNEYLKNEYRKQVKS